MEAELRTPVKLNAAIGQTIARIRPLDEDRRRKAQAHLDCLTKPLGSLGQLEAVAAQYVAWREEEPPRIAGKAVYVFAADHGITDEGRQRLSPRGDPADGAQLPERRSGHQCSGPAYEV